MSSIGGILSIARTAIFTNQAAIQVAAHNISNAGIEGYSRQRPLITTLDPLRLPWGSLGTGVTVADVTRIREAHHDIAVRQELANAAGFGLRRDILFQVESIFGEPSENGLAATLDQFWSAWSDLANSPANLSAKAQVRQRGMQIADTFHRLDRQLSELENATIQRMQLMVSELNDILRQVADLNGRIKVAEAGGKSAGDLRDALDLAIDRAARIADIRVIPQSDGSISLVLGSSNVTSLSDADPVKMSVERGADGRVLGVSFSAHGVPIDPIGSALQGAADGLADIREARQHLDRLAAYITTEVNARHASTPLGRAFFAEPAGGVTAANFQLSEDILADSGNVLAGNGGTDNSIALEIASLRELRIPLTDPDGNPLFDGSGIPLTHSIGGIYRDLVTMIAIRASGADRAATAAEALAQQAQMRRESVSGVSVDEELIQIMRHQQAYAAAAKVVSAVDEMLESLLSIA